MCRMQCEWWSQGRNIACAKARLAQDPIAIRYGYYLALARHRTCGAALRIHVFAVELAVACSQSARIGRPQSCWAWDANGQTGGIQWPCWICGVGITNSTVLWIQAGARQACRQAIAGKRPAHRLDYRSTGTSKDKARLDAALKPRRGLCESTSAKRTGWRAHGNHPMGWGLNVALIAPRGDHSGLWGLSSRPAKAAPCFIQAKSMDFPNFPWVKSAN